MNGKQRKLVDEITAAMEVQGIKQSELSWKTGISQGAISTALKGKYDPKEEKWRLLCEALGLDYDKIVDDPEVETPHQSAAADSFPSRGSLEGVADRLPAEETREGATDPLSAEQNQAEDLALNEEERHLLCVTARYLAGHLKEDIRKGMDISLEDLHTLLTVCKRMQAAAAGTDE